MNEYPLFIRASGEQLCSCGQPYWRHPFAEDQLTWDDQPWLRRLCNGELVKL